MIAIIITILAMGGLNYTLGLLLNKDHCSSSGLTRTSNTLGTPNPANSVNVRRGSLQPSFALERSDRTSEDLDVTSDTSDADAGVKAISSRSTQSDHQYRASTRHQIWRIAQQDETGNHSSLD